jgi:hypothetical protein
MAFTATVCQVYVSGSAGTVLWWFKFRSGKSFFNVYGSFTWLHYNQTNILENQTSLLAHVRFIRMPLAAFWCGFSKNSWRGLFCDSVKSCENYYFAIH